MNFTTRDIDELIARFRQNGGRGKQLEIMSALRRQIRSDYDIKRPIRDERMVENFLASLYPNVLPMKAKEHYLQNVAQINRRLEELFQKGKNPKAIGINAEGCSFDHLKVDMQKEQLRRARRKSEAQGQVIEELRGSLLQLRRQVNQEENRRKITEERLEMFSQEIAMIRREVARLGQMTEEAGREMERIMRPVREHQQEFEFLLATLGHLRAWLEGRLLFRVVRRLRKGNA